MQNLGWLINNEISKLSIFIANINIKIKCAKTSLMLYLLQQDWVKSSSKTLEERKSCFSCSFCQPELILIDQGIVK